MGKYLSPENHKNYETKCALIFYPADESAFYLQAIRGQLSRLAFPWIWEGDEEKQREIAEIWLEHDNMTTDVFFSVDCEDVPVVTGEEPLNVNVNVDCDCGGGGCCNENIVNVQPPELTVIVDVDDTPPPGEYTDDGATPPPDFDTYEEYDAYKCQIAGRMAQDFANTIDSMQTLSGVAGLGGAILMQALFTTSALSGVIVGLMSIGMSAAGAVVLLVAAFVSLAIGGTVLFGYFGLVGAELRDNLDTLRCALYLATTEEEARQAFVDVTNDAVAATAIGSLENGDVFNEVLFRIIDILLPDEVLAVLFGLVDAAIGEGSYDCTGCQQGNESIVWVNPDGNVTFEINTPTEFRVSGTLLEQGVNNEISAAVSLQTAGRDIFGDGVIHGWEFYVEEISTTVPMDYYTEDCAALVDQNTSSKAVLLNSEGVDHNNKSVICHDGTLSGAGYDVEITTVSQDACEGSTGTTSNKAFLRLFNFIGGGQSDTIVMHLSSIFPLDANGERLT
jgi:hypothetical protein